MLSQARCSNSDSTRTPAQSRSRYLPLLLSRIDRAGRKGSSLVALFSLFAALGVPGIAGTAHAYTVRTFSPTDFFSAIGAPTTAETAMLDAAAGTTGFITEDFEDTMLIPGLTLNVPLDLVLHGGPNSFFGGWDLQRALHNLLTSPTDLILNYAPTASSIALGISGLQQDQELWIGTTNLGRIVDLVDDTSGLLNFTSNTAIGNTRNIFVRVDRDVSDPWITEVRITAPDGTFDHMHIDHFQVIPEPNTALLLSLGLVGLSARRRAFRAQL